jgi:hypothetical protein
MFLEQHVNSFDSHWPGFRRFPLLPALFIRLDSIELAGKEVSVNLRNSC